MTKPLLKIAVSKQMGANMFKGRLLALLGSLCLMNSSLVAWEECGLCESNRLYIGGFGGGIYSNSSRMAQMGTAFFLEAEGGPLAVLAQGDAGNNSAGFGGVQIGYEWSKCPLSIGCSDWTVAPALELEGYWYKHTKRGDLINPTDRLPAHEFSDSFPLSMGVLQINAVFSLNSSCLRGFSPYVGGGMGATRISIRNAISTQTEPPEEGVNHFNSKRSDSSWTFAAQAKAGLRYSICQSFHIFGEYRYLFVDSSHFIFGSAVYPDHAATSPWNVKLHHTHYNAFAFGIQYDL